MRVPRDRAALAHAEVGVRPSRGMSKKYPKEQVLAVRLTNVAIPSYWAYQ
jgi:hypothetical protein